MKGTSLIYFFNVYVSSISSSSDIRPKSFSPFLLPLSCTIFIFSSFIYHYSSWNSHSPEDQIRKDFFDWLLSSYLLSFNNSDYPTVLHCSTGNRSFLYLFLILSPATIASKCIWQVLTDFDSYNPPVSFKIPTHP